jgi:hypothetical protein
MLLTISYVIAGLIIVACIYLSISTNLLKNGTSNPKAKYSFSRVQLMWWTIIISCCYIILFAKTSDYNLFNHSALVLLGIGVATSVGAGLIDTSQKQTGLSLHQHNDSKGLFNDILSDENGISMHRLQAVIFNVLFGIIFISIMWMQHKFADFDSSQLTLIGISSGAYLALKTNENKTTPTPVPTPKTNDKTPPSNPS